MFVKAFVIGIFVVAVSSAVPLVTTDPSLDYETILDCDKPEADNTPGPELIYYEVNKENGSVIKSDDSEIVFVPIPDKTYATDELQDQSTSVKSHVHNIFDNLYREFKNSKTGVENKNDHALVKFEKLLKSFTDDVQKAKIAHAATTTRASMSDLKTDWDFAVRNWQNIHKEISSVLDIIIDSFKNVSKKNKILYRNLETELSSIKSKITGLAQQAKKEFTEVVKKGKKDVHTFKSLTSKILTAFTDLKPMVGEVFEEAKNKLNFVSKKFDNFVSHRDSYASEVNVYYYPIKTANNKQ